MLPAIIIAAILAVLFLLIRFVPLRLLLLLENESLQIQFRFLFLRFRLYPQKKPKKKKKNRKKANTAKQKEQPEASAPSKHSLPDTIALITRLFRLFRKKMARKIRIRIRNFHVTVATGDAASCAVLYGTVTQSVSYLIELLQTLFFVTQKKSAISVSADFSGTRSSLTADIAVSVTFFRALQFLISFLLEKRKPEQALSSQITDQ